MENETLILNKLDIIKMEIEKIAEHLDDLTLTKEDILSLREAEADYKKGKTKRL
jgi:hypothetical protein